MRYAAKLSSPRSNRLQTKPSCPNSYRHRLASHLLRGKFIRILFKGFGNTCVWLTLLTIRVYSNTPSQFTHEKNADKIKSQLAWNIQLTGKLAQTPTCNKFYRRLLSQLFKHGLSVVHHRLNGLFWNYWKQSASCTADSASTVLKSVFGDTFKFIQNGSMHRHLFLPLFCLIHCHEHREE